MRHFPTLPFAFCVAVQSLALTSASFSPWSLLSSQSRLGDHGPHVEHHSPLHPSFDSFVDRLMQDWHIPGLAIAVVHENQTWFKGYGYATLPDVPFTPYTLFQAASTTKSFTASLAAILIESAEDLAWDTPLHDIVGNDFVLKDDYLTTHLTFLDAMSHRTGMPRHDALWYDRGLDVESQTYLMRHLDTSASFRTVFQYCNLMFTAVSHVLQSITGRPHADLLRQWIFKPLGMNYSYYSLEDAATCQNSDSRCTLADSYAWNKKTGCFKKWSLDLSNPPNGAGGIISNVVDYSKWIRALMYESGPVSKEGQAIMKYPLSFLGAETSPYAGPGWYGLGIEGGIYRNEKVFSHNGGISAYASTFKFLPDRKFGVVVFQNAQNNAMEAIAWRLIDEFLGVPEDEFYDMNKTQHEVAKKYEEQLESLPSKLYPSVPSIPVKPQLPLQNYTGVYVNAAYENFSVTLEAPAALLDKSEIEESGSAGLPLYATSRGGTVLFTFRHVSSEHWLLEMRMVIYGSKGADDYKKAKFEIGPDGVVQRLGVVMEAAISGDKAWAWFDRSK
ncbi:beta-lactamase/transpeptidase-like protein [Aureobasidium pullulans EXF-150]|uniref:Beta-lactamase/transpeptidase-like protein n=1 Tax=Aureobasidium pullulans EXF-150 TaxID=1043002 RepID=A0A074XJU4_AURPU|nr:beta-lactamase/transpeptidase-like protein [Aureobasidium pullulans EXF-150]KEQ83954.1 beta-lactamase/transpeptidase-like protein [Aureobasidium pullulans EXF-150]